VYLEPKIEASCLRGPTLLSNRQNSSLNPEPQSYGNQKRNCFRNRRPALVVIVKATFVFAMDRTGLAAEQVPISYGDSFYDEKEGGGIRYESDLAPYKPKTDVVLCGKAYAPDNQPQCCIKKMAKGWQNVMAIEATPH
jgi:hypothetical protein